MREEKGNRNLETWSNIALHKVSLGLSTRTPVMRTIWFRKVSIARGTFSKAVGLWALLCFINVRLRWRNSVGHCRVRRKTLGSRNRSSVLPVNELPCMIWTSESKDTVRYTQIRTILFVPLKNGGLNRMGNRSGRLFHSFTFLGMGG